MYPRIGYFLVSSKVIIRNPHPLDEVIVDGVVVIIGVSFVVGSVSIGASFKISLGLSGIKVEDIVTGISVRSVQF